MQPRPGSRRRRLVSRLILATAVVVAGSLVSVLASARTSDPPDPAPSRSAVAMAPSRPAPAAAQADPAPVARAAQARRRAPRREFNYPTTSSPIVKSRSGGLVYSVNPSNDTVSVIRTSSDRVIRQLRTGDEPQSVAVDPSDRYLFVANAAAGTVTVFRITNPNPNRFSATRRTTLRTGSEPWNIVASPDGRRVFVSNSGQDTISVIDARSPRVIGHVRLGNSVCNEPDRERHFQPRGLAVNESASRLYVTGFLAFTRPGGRQAADDGKEGVVCRLSIDTESRDIDDYRPRRRVTVGSQVTGFRIDSTGDGQADDTRAFPNQLQSIVIRGRYAFLPNIAASPDGPLRFDVSTQAFVNVISGLRTGQERDGSEGRFLNLHKGAEEPEQGKKKLFFAGPWAMAFTRKSGAGSAYVVAANSDLLVKLDVSASDRISFTEDENTTRYIDLNDPADAETSGVNAGKNPQGIVINRAGTKAYVNNFVSRNVSIVDLRSDRVVKTVRTANLPTPGSPEEVVHVGAEMFFSSRGNFNRPPNAQVSTTERLSQAGWQSCASCHFKGLTDGVVWEFGAGPRKSVPLNASFNPRNRTQQRLFNYSAIFDEVEDFELNVRNTSGPGPLAAAVACNAPAPNQPATSTFDPAHGLIIGDNGDINTPPCVINAFARPNAERQQVTVTLPGSNVAVPAQTALREWSRNAVRTHSGPSSRRGLRGDSQATVNRGRGLFQAAGCINCHGGSLWTLSVKDFTSPPAAAEIATETAPPPPAGAGNPVGAQYLHRFLRDIGSFNLGVPGGGNEIGGNVGGDEKGPPGINAQGVSQPPQDALGRDFNGDGRGNGYNVPSLLGINSVPPYYHNGACETLACVLSNVRHRTANGTLPDRLSSASDRAAVEAFLRSIGVGTQPFG
jgi:YVTN family beta-propeller protein